MTSTTTSDPSCWASSLGGCGGGPSREHFISRSQFDSDTIRLRGLPWCPEEREIGLASLVSKNLCRVHNATLSPADTEAQKLRDALYRVAIAADCGETELHIDGPLIVRWLLKTAVNLVLQRGGEIGDYFDEPNVVVAVAFGRETLSTPAGLRWIATVGEQPGDRGRIEFETLNRRIDGRVVGAGFRFHGYRMCLALPGCPAIADTIQPIRRINKGSLAVVFNW